MVGKDEAFEISNGGFLPIVSAYAARIGLVEQIDHLLHCRMEVSPGRVVLALILDALSGRSPLFRLEQFFVDKDVEHLLGEAIPRSRFNDDTLGRVLDRLADVGTNTVLGAVMIGVMKSFDLDMSHVHHDVTSHSVYGDYLLYEWEGHGQPFVITEGFSRDHRPDLKQLTHSLLCVDHGIPISSTLLDGNQSDKTINKNLIPEMVERMRSLGREDFIYVADSALITEDNLTLIDDWDKGFLFVSRLPMTYGECRAAIEQAVEADQWEEIGVISDEPEAKNRKPASYRSFETAVTLYGITYRALVVHSDAYDQRRQKRVDKGIAREHKELTRLIKGLEAIDYACLPDARAAAERIRPATFHQMAVEIEPRAHYGKGRPKADGTRALKEITYRLKVALTLNEGAIERLRHEAGCFVLISNTLGQGTGSISARKLLTIYKDQHMVERNFAFLKDPVFVNALFLKSPRRIEALGLVLILALLVWRLMERTMRLTLAATKSKVTGWEKRQTSRPTSLMLTTKFIGAFVLISSGTKRLAKPLAEIQLHYLDLLELTPDALVNPFARQAQKKKHREKMPENHHKLCGM
jgi:transposase